MKFIALLLNVYLLLLPCVPCSDEAGCATENPASLHVQKENRTSKGHDDLCSPFCSCACGASNILYQANAADKQIAKHILQQKYCQLIMGLSTFNGTTIWQPPKV